ncbi:MAG: DUF2842 domain-containing protein [Parvularculaceae bacterium]|jgi:hypothetical protein|nr:DUF2842 domain-containing protein [Parvularculaceae bacterium]
MNSRNSFAVAPRLRKLLGVSLLLPLLGAYLFGAALLGALVPPRWWLQTPFYIAAGILWAFPAIALVRWMERDARTSRNGTGADETPR